MLVRLALARVGSYIGHAADNLRAFGLSYDEQELSLEELLNQKSLDSVIGKPIVLDHCDGAVLGYVDSVEVENNVPYALGQISDSATVKMLDQAKAEGRVLETSPKFSSGIRLDSMGRVEQYDRAYEHIAILSPGLAGRGGSSISAKYSKDSMEDEKYNSLTALIEGLSAKMDALVAKVAEQTEIEAAEPSESEGSELEAEYQKGFEEGKVEAEYAYKVQTLAKQRGLELKSESNEAKATELLTSFGITANYASSRVAVDTLLALGVSPAKVAPVEATDPILPAQKAKRQSIRVKI